MEGSIEDVPSAELVAEVTDISIAPEGSIESIEEFIGEVS